MDVSSERLIFREIPHATIMETWLPNVRANAKQLPSSKRKATLDKLNCFLHGDNGSNQQMEVIRHDDKLMNLVFALTPIIKQSLNEEPCGSRRLKKGFLLE